MPKPQGEVVTGKRLEIETRYGATWLFYDPADEHAILYQLLQRLRRDGVAAMQRKLWEPLVATSSVALNQRCIGDAE